VQGGLKSKSVTAMIWSVGVSVPRRYENDFERFSLRPFTLRSDTIRYAVRGQFKLKDPFAHYGFQNEGYFGWGVRGGPYFKGTVFQYLRAFGIFEDSLNNRLYIIDPFNMFSYGWYIEEPYPRGQAGAHIMHGALKTSAFMSNSYGRGVDVCFNHDRSSDPTYFPPPSSAFFEDANSFVYTGNPADPRITCPALIRSDWWERLRFYLRIFDTVYILKPTEYARRCYYRLIEDELPARLTAIFTAEDYPKKPLRTVARDLFGPDFPSEVKGYGFGISARVGWAAIAPSFAQRNPKDPLAPYPITSMLSPTPPFVAEIPNLVATAVGKEMTYTPWVSLCMYPGPTYHGNWTEIDGWGAVPPIEPMSEIQFESWRQGVRERGGGGVTLFQINPDGDIHYIRTGQPFLIWGGTCGDYILLEPFDTDAQTETTTKVKVLKEGWHTTSGGLRIYSIYFIQVSVVLQTTTYYLDRVNAYEPPEPETIEETFFPYFTVERVHKLLKGARKLLLKPKCSFARPSKINFTEVLNEMINPNAREYVSADFGTVWTEGPPGYTCSNVQVWHLGGQSLYIDPLTDRVSSYFAQKEMDDPTANRRFFVNLVGPFMDKVARDFLVPRLSGPNSKLEEVVARHAPSRVALTGWKGFDVSNMSPNQIPWTMTSSGNIYTLEDKAAYFGMFQLYSKIPILSSPNGLEIAKKLLSQLPPFDPQVLPEGYELRPLPSPSVLGVGESAEGGDGSGPVVIIGLGTAGSWASIHPDKNKLREKGFIVDGLGSWTPIPLAMLYRDPSEPKPDTRIYPNKLLFKGSCVEPPELQVIPRWFVWSGSILLYSQSPNDPDSALERVRDKTYDLARKIQLVNAAKWRLKQFPDDWETFDRILPLLEFNHIPFVESGRSVVEWFVVNGEKRLRLASYYQPLIVADIKAAAPMETAAFEGAFAGCTHGSSISCALVTRREHYPHPASLGASPQEVADTAQQIYGQLGDSVENIGGLNIIPPHNLLAPFNISQISENAYPYFGDYNAAIPPYQFISTTAPLLSVFDVDMDVFHPPFFARFSVVPHPIHNEVLWDSGGFYSDLRKTLLEITSIVPVTLPSYQPPPEGAVRKINQDPLLFYQRIGKEGLGKTIEFWEKCSLVVGNGSMAVYAYIKENKPVFSGFTLSGGFFRNIHRRDYQDILFASAYIAPVASQMVQNITNLAAGKQVFKENARLWQRYVIKMSPYNTWIGLELLTPPVICFFGKGFSGRDTAAEAVIDKGREISLAFADNEYPPIGDKGWQFLVGYRQQRFITAHLGVPPLPSDFLEVEIPSGVRDYGAFWRRRFKNHTIAGDLFAWVVPPLGWLGCVGIPGVSKLGVDPILPVEREDKRFEEGRVEYAYGNKERLRNYWVEEIRLDGEYARKEYYLQLPNEDSLVIPDEEKIYPDDKEVRDSGEFEGRRLITLCKSSRWQKQKIYWSFRSYFDIWRTRVKQEDKILAPEEVRLRVRATRHEVLHQWASGRERYYVLPLFPVQWWGVPITFTWGNDIPFWRDIIPNEYGSITFSLSVAYPFPFGRLKELLKEHAQELVGENEEFRQFLHRTCVAMGWTSADSRMLLKDLISVIPDDFLIGQPWYAPFAAYYITEQPLLPMRKEGYYAYALVEDFIRRYSHRLLHVNLSPTVFPEWYASQRLMNALGRLNWNRLINGASRRYPVCIIAQRSPFLTGGATYSEDYDMLFYFSHLNVPDPFVQPMLPEDIFGAEAWLETLLTPAAGKAPSYLNRTWVMEHTKPLNEIVDTQYSGIFANNFVPPFSPVPYQTYPFSIPPFIMKNWGLYRVPYWQKDILDEVKDGYTCDFQDLVYCDPNREDFSVEPRIDSNDLSVIYGQLKFRDCAMPNQTIGLSTWGGYAYLHRIVLPPTPIIVHSSFNFGWAEYKGIREKEDEKTFQLIEPKLTKVPYRSYNELIVRSYFYGMRLNFSSPQDPPPLPDVLSSWIREQDGLYQAWGIFLPVRFYYSHIRNRLNTDKEWLSNNEYLQQEREEAPISFYGKVMAGLPAFIFACRTWRLHHEVIDIAFSDKEEIFLVVRGNRLPRYWWVNHVVQGSKYSALLKVDYVLRHYYPVRFRRASPWHALFDPIWGEKKLLKMVSHAWSAVFARLTGQSILIDAKQKKGFVRPAEISLLPLPLRIIRIDVASRRPIAFASTYRWWEDWKEPFLWALKSSDEEASLYISRLHVPFITSIILENFLREMLPERELWILMQTPIAVIAKIFLDGIASVVAPFSG
jgi:hypothetical protein